MTKLAYDALNRVSSITDPAGGVTTIAYDAHDRPLTVTDANGNATRFAYDGFGGLIQQLSPNTGATVFSYDADGNRVQSTDARGVITNYGFDALGRPIPTTYPGDERGCRGRLPHVRRARTWFRQRRGLPPSGGCRGVLGRFSVRRTRKPLERDANGE